MVVHPGRTAVRITCLSDHPCLLASSDRRESQPDSHTLEFPDPSPATKSPPLHERFGILARPNVVSRCQPKKCRIRIWRQSQSALTLSWYVVPNWVTGPMSRRWGRPMLAPMIFTSVRMCVVARAFGSDAGTRGPPRAHYAASASPSSLEGVAIRVDGQETPLKGFVQEGPIFDACCAPGGGREISAQLWAQKGAVLLDELGLGNPVAPSEGGGGPVQDLSLVDAVRLYHFYLPVYEWIRSLLGAGAESGGARTSGPLFVGISCPQVCVWVGAWVGMCLHARAHIYHGTHVRACTHKLTTLNNTHTRQTHAHARSRTHRAAARRHSSILWWPSSNPRGCAARRCLSTIFI